MLLRLAVRTRAMEELPDLTDRILAFLKYWATHPLCCVALAGLLHFVASPAAAGECFYKWIISVEARLARYHVHGPLWRVPEACLRLLESAVFVGTVWETHVASLIKSQDFAHRVKHILSLIELKHADASIILLWCYNGEERLCNNMYACIAIQICCCLAQASVSLLRKFREGNLIWRGGGHHGSRGEPTAQVRGSMGPDVVLLWAFSLDVSFWIIIIKKLHHYHTL